MTIQWTRNGQPCDAPNGYNVADYFPGVDVTTATREELSLVYLGDDEDGIGVTIR